MEKFIQRQREQRQIVDKFNKQGDRVSRKPAVDDECEIKLQAKYKRLLARYEELDKELDACHDITTYSEIVQKRSNLRYHLDITLDRLNNRYVTTPIPEVSE